MPASGGNPVVSKSTILSSMLGHHDFRKWNRPEFLELDLELAGLQLALVALDGEGCDAPHPFALSLVEVGADHLSGVVIARRDRHGSRGWAGHLDDVGVAPVGRQKRRRFDISNARGTSRRIGGVG